MAHSGEVVVVDVRVRELDACPGKIGPERQYQDRVDRLLGKMHGPPGLNDEPLGLDVE